MTSASDPAAGNLADDRVFDVAVIGAGIVGAAIARELAGHTLGGQPISIALLDAREDVGDGTSKANTAILHTGFDAKPGTLESELVQRGYHLMADYAGRTGIPVEYTGALLVAWTDEERDALPGLREKATLNEYDKCEIVSADEVYHQVPDLGPGVMAGLTVPDEAIICTWTASLALATDAVGRGVSLLLNHRVTDVHAPEPPGFTVLGTTAGEVRARWVVNAAGLGCDEIDQLFGHDRFTVTPRRGELFVFDKLARPMVNRIVLPVPSSKGKGVLVSPTIYGNVMLGPTAEDLTDRTATGTSEDGFNFLLDKGQKLMPKLLDEEVTATYAGLRAAINHGDYLIELDPDHHYLLVAGIRSTGLTSSIAVGEHTRELLIDGGFDLKPRQNVPAPPHMPNIGEAGIRPYQDAERIAADPAYGRVICFCERVTAGEVRDAFSSLIPPCTLEGLRRRTRVMNGRCQGFFCGAEVAAHVETRGRTASAQPQEVPR